MPRAKWLVAALTVALLSTGIAALQRTDGARPAPAAAAATDDALPSRALGLSDHRRLVRQLDHFGEHAPGRGARSPRTAPGPLRGVDGPLRPARPLRLRVPDLGVDVSLTGPRPAAAWDGAGPAPGAEGTAVIAGASLDLSGLRRGMAVEVPRADGRTAVFTVVRASAGGRSALEDRPGRAQLRLTGGETAVLARLTGQRRGR